MAQRDGTSRMFEQFAATAVPRAPLYAHLSERVADDPELVALMDVAPLPQRLPVLFFAAAHYLLLGEPTARLAAHYPNLSDHPATGDAFPAFREFVLDRSADMIELLSTRSTQTNEVGRCALFVPVFAALEADMGPLAHVDVGASCGLNLLSDRYRYRYEPGCEVGPASTVELECSVRGSVPRPTELPTIAARIGLDQSPINPGDVEATRWLEACVWPDQLDRFARLRAAIALARLDPPPIRAGDAVGDVAETIADVADSGHPVVTTSWVLSYLTEAQRRAFVAELDVVGERHDLTWIAAESPAQTSGLPWLGGDDQRTVLLKVQWRRGRRSVEQLAVCHPHGYWMHWFDAQPR